MREENGKYGRLCDDKAAVETMVGIPMTNIRD